MLNIGVLGAGMMGRVHCSNYMTVKGARVAAVYRYIRGEGRSEMGKE